MIYEFEYMLHLAGCGALDQKPAPPAHKLNLLKVLEYAKEQSVSSFVFYALNNASFDISDNVKSVIKGKLRAMTINAAVKRIGVLDVLKECYAKGLNVVVLKGFSTALCYQVPELRISADTDLLVDYKDEEAVMEIFEKNGFEAKKRTGKMKDSHLIHNMYGVVELHVELLESYIKDIWYKGSTLKLQDKIVITTKDGNFSALDKTDQLIFTIQHMMKHFIVEGLSVQMILDVGVIMTCYRDCMDFDRVKDELDKTNYCCAVNAIINILNTYCGFFINCSFASEVKVNSDTVELLIDDMEAGGTRGYLADRQERHKTLYAYNAKLIRGRNGLLAANANAVIRFICNLFRMIFPSRELLEAKYKVEKIKFYMLPYYYVRRIAEGRRDNTKHIRISFAEISQMNTQGKNNTRMKLFSNMDLI